MRAELKWIEPNDPIDLDAAQDGDPLDAYGWFTLGIGPADEEGAENFQVLVSTPGAVSRAQGDARRFRGLVVSQFTLEDVRSRVQEHVASLSGSSWADIVEQLRPIMRWEYEGMRGR